MVLRSFFTGVFIITSLYLLLTYQLGMSLGAPGNNNQDNHRSRGFGRYSRPVQYARIKTDPFVSDFIVDDDDFLEFSKRQQSNSDDYGHMRFGRKGEELSDDYGHMRFGRSNAENK